MNAKPDAPPADPTFDYAALKREARLKRKLARMPSKAHRACFWTWPWGHVFEYEDRIGLIFFYKCASCGKAKVSPPA